MNIQLLGGYFLSLNKDENYPVDWKRICLVTKDKCVVLQSGQWGFPSNELISLSTDYFENDQEYATSCFVDCLNMPQSHDEDLTIDHPAMYELIEAWANDLLYDEPPDWLPTGKPIVFDGYKLIIDERQYNFPTTESSCDDFDIRDF